MILNRLIRALEAVALETGRLADALVVEEGPSINLSIAAVHGRRRIVNIDRGSAQLVDTEKVLLSIAAKDAGGVTRAFTPDQFQWSSSDENVIALEENPDDAYTRWARTPTPGSATVTVTGPNGDTETITLVVVNSGPGEIGLSAGTPVPE